MSEKQVAATIWYSWRPGAGSTRRHKLRAGKRSVHEYVLHLRRCGFTVFLVRHH